MHYPVPKTQPTLFMIACLETHAYVTSCLHRCIAGLILDGPRGISAQVMAPTSLSHPKHTTNMSSMLGCCSQSEQGVGCIIIAFHSLHTCAKHAFFSSSFLPPFSLGCSNIAFCSLNACAMHAYPFFVCGLHQHCIPQFESRCNACIPAGEVCLSEMGATAEASLEPMAIPTSAAARAARSLMPSPQYMHVFPKP